MSVEAMGWAFRQKLPPKPKILLLALADQTDETTGRVCYGRTDARHLAQKCSISESSLYRYLAALIRNGYAIRESGKERGATSQFWLCLDRPPTTIEEWQWKIIPSDGDPDDDTQDVEGGSVNLTEGESIENAPETAQIDRGGLPHGDRPRVSGRHQHISARASGEEESSFSRKAQDLERESVGIRKAASQENARQFVIENSRAWNFWLDHRRKTGVRPWTLPTCAGTGEFAGKRGWYLPSLFPPSGHDPPQTMTDDEAEQLFANR